MPRDVFISAVRGRAFMWSDEEGHRYYPMPYKASVSYSLDALTQVPGSMLFRDSGLWVPVPGGTAGEFLTYVDDDTPPAWTTPTPFTLPFSGARVRKTSDQTISASTTTDITFDAERFDTDGYHEGTTHPERLTIPTSGYYYIGANVEWDANATGFREAAIQLNATTDIAKSRFFSGSSSTYDHNLGALWLCTAGDYFKLRVRQTTAGNLKVLSVSAYSPEFWIHRIPNVT
jgi:hypothetical protein